MLAYCALCRMVCLAACIGLITALVPGAARAQSRVHEATVVLDPGHGVAGNRLRRQGNLVLEHDEEWKDNLPTYARILAPLSWPVARWYGYDLFR